MRLWMKVRKNDDARQRRVHVLKKKKKVQRQTSATELERGTRVYSGETSKKAPIKEGNMIDKVWLYLLIPPSVVFVALGMVFFLSFSPFKSGREHVSIPSGDLSNT